MRHSSHTVPTSFHPTISFARFLAYLVRSFRPSPPQAYLDQRFPDNTTQLTDSGRSAFALTIEHLNLRGKTLALPAYVCDALLPVLIHYEIQPLFLDIDDKHYQPPQEAYTDQILSSADAVLLVATYGKRPDPAIVSHLQEHRKIIIEDYATLSPLCNDPVYGAARIYSLPKTLPTPDGGLAILPQDTRTSKLRAHKLSLTFIKNLFKLLPGIASRIARVRDTVSYSSNSASWSGITEPSNITKVIFDEYCKKPTPEGVDERYSYCYPLRVRDPGQALQKLRQHGISAERIWHRPIISHPEAKKRFNLDLNKYPNTMKIASEVVCVPLFHIDDQQSYDHYVRTLQKILADLLCE